MFQNTTIDNNAQKTEFSDSARDMFKLAINTEKVDEYGVSLLVTDVPATTSPILPSELVERILLLLDTKSMVKCRLVNKQFNEIIQASTVLEYFLACNAASVIDNPQSPLSYRERLEALRKHEEAWRTLKPVFEMTIKVDHQPFMMYALNNGTFFFRDSNMTDLHYCHLPSFSQDDPRWGRIPANGPGEPGLPGIYIEFAIAIYEHDLIINVVSSDTGNQTHAQRYSIDLVLLKFSTGEYHPLAQHPRIHVQRSPHVRPSIMPRVVGNNLALIIHSEGDKLYIFDWKSGHKRLQHEATPNAYLDFLFISPEILLVPNLVLSHFEVWHIPPSHLNHKPLAQILSLKIPAVSSDYLFYDVRCHGEPNLFLQSLPYFPPRPFFSSPENSIIWAKLHLQSIKGPWYEIYTLIMHRHTLLNTIQKWTSASLEQDSATWLTNEITVDRVSDANDESVRLTVQSASVSMSHPRTSPRSRGYSNFVSSPNSSTLHTSANSDSSSISSGSPTTTQYDFYVVQWADWGPSTSRWFRDNRDLWWITSSSSSGQRYAFTIRHPRDRTKLSISIADFNPYNIRRNAERMAQPKEGKDNGDNGEAKKKEEEELERLDHGGIFSEEVYMGLKCVVHHAPGEYDFKRVLMDDERVVVVNVKNGMEASIKILYFG